MEDLTPGLCMDDEPVYGVHKSANVIYKEDHALDGYVALWLSSQAQLFLELPAYIPNNEIKRLLSYRLRQTQSELALMPVYKHKYQTLINTDNQNGMPSRDDRLWIEIFIKPFNDNLYQQYRDRWEEVYSAYCSRMNGELLQFPSQ